LYFKVKSALKPQGTFIDYILKEWLLVASGTGLVLTSIYTKHFPGYSVQDLQVLFILFVLFIAVNGLQQSGLILKIARVLEQGKAIPLKLILATYFLSMLVTNDVALIVIVPLTLSLKIDRKDTNAGSALTPFGNPQNLFIYWFYEVNPVAFIELFNRFSINSACFVAFC